MQSSRQNSEPATKPPGDEHTALLVIDVQVGLITGEAQLNAAQIIEHHNIVLSQLAHPNGSATLVTSSAWSESSG